MTVAELISFLQTQPQSYQVAYKCYSEQCLLRLEDIETREFGVARPDGWVPDLRGNPAQMYVLFPGN